MKIDENKPHSIHLRLTNEQFEFLKNDAEMLGIGVSDYARMLINTSMYASNKLASTLQNKLGDLKNANNQNNI